MTIKFMSYIQKQTNFSIKYNNNYYNKICNFTKSKLTKLII
jgi:hypothetical protein